jgi:hypothetical protein
MVKGAGSYVRTTEAGFPPRQRLKQRRRTWTTINFREALSLYFEARLFKTAKHGQLAMPRVLKVILVMALGLVGAAAAQPDQASSIVIRSSAFLEGGIIPKRYTCEGADWSPPLSLSRVPRGTKTLALIVFDPDAPGGTFTHWALYNLPGDVSTLPENLPRTPSIIDGGLQTLNDFGRVGYNGPCPPPGPPHHYHFQIYALATALRLASNADARALREAMRGHVLASGETVALFGR